MEEDEYPNFSNAFPSAVSISTPTPSQDPAVRPDTSIEDALSATQPHTQDEDDDFFARYPDATPRKSQDAANARTETEAGREDEDEAEEARSPVPRSQSITVESTIDVQRADASSGSPLQRPSSYAYAEGPTKQHPLPEEMDDEAVAFAQDASRQEQDEGLDRYAASDTDELVDSSQVTSDAPRTPEEATGHTVRAEEHYEHQGEVTDMKEAQDESDQIPLMQDEEALPTFDPVEESSIVDPATLLEESNPPQQQQKRPRSHFSHPPIDRSFTTNFTAFPNQERQNSEVARAHGIVVSADWPSVGDDKLFGDLLERRDEPQTLHDHSRHRQPEIRPTTEGSDTSNHSVVVANAASDDTFDEPAPLEGLLEDGNEAGEEDLAAAWQAALDDDDLLDESDDLDPSKFFDEDGEGFLEDENPVENAASEQAVQSGTIREDQRSQTGGTSQPEWPSQRISYGMSSTPLSQVVHGRAAGTPDTGLFDIYNQPNAVQQQQQQSARPALNQAQSFADKSKGGYQSPYDLPMEVVKPRRRPQQPQTQSEVPLPPPRSTSFQLQASPPPNSSHSGIASARSPPLSSTVSPPPSSHSSANFPAPSRSANGAQVSAKSTPKEESGFFADLPIAPKLRNRPSGAYTPQPMAAAPLPPPSQPPAPSQAYPPYRSAAPPTSSITHQQDSAAFGLVLQAPEKLPLLPEQPSAPSVPFSSASPSNSRYSPAAPQLSQGSVVNRFSPAPQTSHAPNTLRYSPAPAASTNQAMTRQLSGPPSAPPSAHPFAPRTSSPLAYQTGKVSQPLPMEAIRNLTTSPPRLMGREQAVRMSPEKQKYNPQNSNRAVSPELNSMPLADAARSPPSQGPPARPRTQSPGATIRQPRLAMTGVERPTSAAAASSNKPRGPALPHRRQFSRDLTFTAPQDERSQDVLQRWKGCPIFKWSAGGTVLSSLPKQTPFYAAGHGIPSIKCTPGDIAVQDASNFFPMEERNAKFPGPLPARNKGKKKDVLAWLSGKIEDLERQTEGVMLDFSISPDLKKRAEEKVVLWKIVRILVTHDGVLEGNPKADDEVRAVLLPNLAQLNRVADLQSPTSTTVQAEPVDRAVLIQIRQALLEGQRDRAVWLAEEKKLWGHAMLIASTMGADIWRQVIQSFVRSHVKTVGSDARSLAALYQIFAGNSEDCVDELVPPSARAGFQMVSKDSGTAATNPLEGLDQWRETLGLVVSNRTASDGQSLVALGKLLASYGRVEAAHTCYLFARGVIKLTGADDADAHVVLFGANHRVADESFGNDLDSILLTEIYEWMCSLSAPSTAVPYVPHLQAFKLLHAQNLAAHGLKTKAQAYCDHITSAYTSTTRPSGYYHPTFTTSVAELSAMLSQSPQDGKSGFFSKPAMNKVSSGAASWFTKFVSGEDDREASTMPGTGTDGIVGAGPFGGLTGDTPPISRAASTTEVYNPNMAGVPVPAATTPSVQGASALQYFAPSTAPNKYAPSTYTPNLNGASHLEVQRPATANYPVARPLPGTAKYAPSQLQQALSVPRPEASRAASDYGVPYGSAAASRRGSAQDCGSPSIYEPRPPLSVDAMPSYGQQAFDESTTQAAGAGTTVGDAFARPNGNDQQHDAIEAAPFDEEGGGGCAPPLAEEDPSTLGYEPPTTGYVPYEPEPDSPEDNAPPTKPKKNFMDDDEDDTAELARRAAALKKSQADREADDAFRKAAEADAARDKDDKDFGDKKAGWFGGWFGGKKDAHAGPGPIRAKLGEENSFYYDENLKKWVNKKGGSEAATPAAATPPPPRGPASRVASAALGPPSGPPSRAGSAMGASRPPTAAAGTTAPSFPAAAAPSSGPPSRIATPASQESGTLPVPSAPVANGEPTSAPPSRPATSMSTASSLDDLLGGPPGGARNKAGTVKGKKKAGRYVDVMAK